MDDDRYGPTIDDLYEQELREQARIREVRATFDDGEVEVIRKFSDTPEERVRADKFAAKLLEHSNVVSVEVAPVGPVAPPKRGGTKRVPALAAGPTRTPLIHNRVGCCSPDIFRGPSGVRRRHSMSCDTAPGSPYIAPVVDIRGARLAAKHAAQSRRVGLDEAIATHPSAGGVLTANGGHCPAHPEQGVWDCIACADRRV